MDKAAQAAILALTARCNSQQRDIKDLASIVRKLYERPVLPVDEYARKKLDELSKYVDALVATSQHRRHQAENERHQLRHDLDSLKIQVENKPFLPACPFTTT